MGPKVIKRHLNFIRGFKKLQDGIRFIFSIPMLPFMLLLNQTERGRRIFERGLMFLPNLMLSLLALGAFPITFLIQAFTKKDILGRLFEGVRKGVLPFLMLAPLFCLYAALQIPAQIINHVLGVLVWLPAQFVALFGGAPKAKYLDFYNIHLWESAEFLAEIVQAAPEHASRVEDGESFLLRRRTTEVVVAADQARPAAVEDGEQSVSKGYFTPQSSTAFVPSVEEQERMEAESEAGVAPMHPQYRDFLF